jgi:hypothetical protein
VYPAHTPPSEIAQVRTVTATFQAGHASSILVTRSTAKGLVSSLLNMPKLFEHQHNKNDRAGYIYSMIIGTRPTEVPCQAELHGPRIGLAEVDHARCRAHFVPNIFMSFSCKDWAQSPTTGMPAVIACCYGEGDDHVLCQGARDLPSRARRLLLGPTLARSPHARPTPVRRR